MHKDDDVEIPSLTLDQDELSERAPHGASPAKANKRRLNPPPARPDVSQSAAHAQATKKTSLAGVYFLLFLIVGGAGAGGYWLWLENQKLRSELLGARSQIQDLDHQLVAADATTNQLGSTVEETLKNHDSEIRKLWGVSYDTNRKAIAKNGESLEVLEAKIDQLRETVTTQSKLVAIQGDAFNEMEDGYNRLVDSVSAVESAQQEQGGRVEAFSLALNKSSDEQSALIASQKQKITELEKQLGKLEQSIKQFGSKLDGQSKDIQVLSAAPQAPAVPDGLENRLQNTEEAIRSIDEFRPQVLREINSIKAQLRQLALQQSLNGG